MPICPHCQTALDASTQVAGKAGEPEPGDLTFCSDCGTWANFGPNGTMVPLSPEDEILVATDPFFSDVKEA